MRIAGFLALFVSTSCSAATYYVSNDGNDRAPGSGLQLGFCPPVDPACMVPDSGCATGHCRRLCDLYAGTARTLLAGAMIKVIRPSVR